MKKYSFAIIGATGMVGRTFIKVLEERDLPVGDIYFFASFRTAGQKISFMGKDYIVEELTHSSFDRGIDIALFSAGGGISKEFAPTAVAKGAVVIDNSSAWRMDPDVPLVVPEVNPEDIRIHNGIIANPNCSTIQAVVALKPLLDAYGINRIVYSTYQSVSGAGKKGTDELRRSLAGEEPFLMPHPIAGNCIPHIDIFMENGYTKEEMKMIWETRKIMHAPNLRITATTVRVPVFISHSESINVELKKGFELDELRNLLASSPGIVVQDDPANNVYPLARNASGKDETFVGRLRRDESIENGLNMWVVSDNTRKGAATNTVQIAQELIRVWEDS